MSTAPPRDILGASFKAIERLAERVLAGNVVFFIGSGFSIASEGNSANRLIGRLLARLVALASTLRARDPASSGAAIIDQLGSAFRLKDVSQRDPAACVIDDNVSALAREYYNFNEWVITAFGLLTDELLAVPVGERHVIAKDIHDCDRKLLARLKDQPIPLDPVAWERYKGLTTMHERGKALFLDTMGFANPRVMAGEPGVPDAAAVRASYGERLGMRHHVLARLAREGLLPLIVTTNYDLLIEGAYRLAGLDDGDRPSPQRDALPGASVSTFARVASARHFFATGGAQRTAHLLKIHGCVENYRAARATVPDSGDAPATPWAAYLPALVFSYREIQTWRNDAWSRDLVRTQLRTRSLALCGYSVADPILHSTFREVYDEMAAVGARSDIVKLAEDAPLFFFDVAGKREFHGGEILRSATRAAGLPEVRLLEHPNHVEFEITRGAFPQLDDQFRWLAHTVLRRVQAQALGTYLRRLAPRLLGRPCADREHATLVKAFGDLRVHEAQIIHQDRNSALAGSPAPDSDAEWARRRAHADAATRDTFDGVTGWTWHFLPGFLRELALAELVEARQGPGNSLQGVRDWPWYFPANERLEWTAWCTICELAIRDMVRRVRVDGGQTDDSIRWVVAEESPHAVLSFSDGRHVQPTALCIRLKGFERLGRAMRLTGAFRKVIQWELTEQDVPWSERVRRVRGRPLAPPAALLWRFALGDAGWGTSRVAKVRALRKAQRYLEVEP